MVMSSAPKGLRPDLSGCQEDPPPFVWFLNEKGVRVAVAFLWLDNITIACHNAPARGMGQVDTRGLIPCTWV